MSFEPSPSVVGCGPGLQHCRWKLQRPQQPFPVEQVHNMALYFFSTESFRSSMLSLIWPLQEVAEWVKSSMTCCAVFCFASFFSLAKALACPAARQMTNFRFILLLFSLGRSSFCNWAKQELILRSPITPFTSVVEPSTRVLRVELPPERDEMSLPLLKQVCRIVEAQIVAMERTVRKMAGK